MNFNFSSWSAGVFIFGRKVVLKPGTSICRIVVPSFACIADFCPIDIKIAVSADSTLTAPAQFNGNICELRIFWYEIRCAVLNFIGRNTSINILPQAEKLSVLFLASDSGICNCWHLLISLFIHPDMRFFDKYFFPNLDDNFKLVESGLGYTKDC